MPRTLLAAVRAELTAAAEPARAPAMQAYMKSAMPFLGVPSTARRAAEKRAFAAVELPTAESFRDAVLSLWRGASYREERYAAMGLAGDRRFKAHQTLDALPMYEEMIVTGAWWDYVDEVAANRVGALLARYPKPMTRTMLAWSKSPDMWKRRSSIICQLRFKAKIDLDLLYACIEPSIGSKEFFLRKGIGWALRQHAWTDPAEVLRYVRENAARLAPFTKREALKNVIRSGLAAEIP